MTRIVLTRHGQSQWHADNRYTGSSDVGLTERGLAQAEALGAWARDAGLAAVWSSDLDRARRTAQPAAAAIGAEVRVEPRLRELDFGRAEGRTLEQMRAIDPDAVAAFLADPAGSPMPGGEAPALAARRAHDGLAHIAARHPGERVLVVTHSTLLRLLLCRLFGLPLTRYRTVFPFVRNASITEIGWDGDEVTLLEYNSPIDHVRSLVP